MAQNSFALATRAQLRADMDERSSPPEEEIDVILLAGGTPLSNVEDLEKPEPIAS